MNNNWAESARTQPLFFYDSPIKVEKLREHHRIISCQAEMIESVKEDVKVLQCKPDYKIGMIVAICTSVVAIIVSLIQLFI